MSLDLQPGPEQGRPAAPAQSADPVAELSQQSGVPTEALQSLSSEERAGMASLEASVAQAVAVSERPDSGVTTEMAAALVEARNQVRADVASRVPTSAEAPRGTSEPDDARLRIRGNTITIETDIKIYGSAASQQVADAFERQIESDWDRNPATGDRWTYTDPTHGRTYTVRFDVDVDLYNPDDPLDGPNLVQRNMPFDRTNYIEVVDAQRAAEIERTNVQLRDGFVSHVELGDEGKWRGFNLGGVPVVVMSEASHEFGHLLGFRDRYTAEAESVNGRNQRITTPNAGYRGNIMAELGGQVDVSMIDRLVEQYVARMNASGHTSYDVGIDNDTASKNQL